MFRSIRWKLVASYVVLAILIMSMAGLIAIWAIKHYAQQQEKKYLFSFAETIAEQAHPYLWPELKINNLSQLVQSASFFGNVQVQILDQNNRILVDLRQP